VHKGWFHYGHTTKSPIHKSFTYCHLDYFSKFDTTATEAANSANLLVCHNDQEGCSRSWIGYQWHSWIIYQEIIITQSVQKKIMDCFIKHTHYDHLFFKFLNTINHHSDIFIAFQWNKISLQQTQFHLHNCYIKISLHPFLDNKLITSGTGVTF